MAESGVPIERVEEAMGHANIPTALKIYTHMMDRRRHGAADRMAERTELLMWETSGKHPAWWSRKNGP